MELSRSEGHQQAQETSSHPSGKGYLANTLDVLAQPYRTIVLIALCFGLRISEILGLPWTDFDFKRSVVLIQRSAVGKRLNKLKTEYSQDEVPIERGFILELKKWQALCLDCEDAQFAKAPIIRMSRKLQGILRSVRL